MLGIEHGSGIGIPSKIARLLQALQLPVSTVRWGCAPAVRTIGANQDQPRARFTAYKNSAQNSFVLYFRLNGSARGDLDRGDASCPEPKKRPYIRTNGRWCSHAARALGKRNSLSWDAIQSDRWLVPFAKPKPRNALTPGKKHFRRKAEPKVVRTVTLPYVTRDRCCSSKGLGWPRRLPILID